MTSNFVMPQCAAHFQVSCHYDRESNQSYLLLQEGTLPEGGFDLFQVGPVTHLQFMQQIATARAYLNRASSVWCDLAQSQRDGLRDLYLLLARFERDPAAAIRVAAYEGVTDPS